MKKKKAWNKGQHKRFCKCGHDTWVTGRGSYGRCIACNRAQSKQRREDVKSGKLKLTFKKQFCVHGHDTLKVGRNKEGACIECLRINGRKQYEKNREKRVVKMKEYYQNHKEEYRLWGINYRAQKGEELLEQKRQYGATHRKERNKYLKEQRETNMNHKLQVHLRTRIRLAIKNNQKVGSAVKDLGCSIEFLIAYIQEQFYNKMTWDNWGTYWELDHIKALMFFDLTDRKQFLKAIHFTNLQPLTIPDHKKKTAKELKIKSLTNMNKSGKLERGTKNG